MLINGIRHLIENDLRAVDEVIRARLYSDVELIRNISEYIVQNGGKRLRPTLVLLSAGAFNYQGKSHHDLAAVVEFIHTATLLHDDVVDESALRRGSATANTLYGNAASVLVGDFVYSRAFQMMVSIGQLRVMEVLADATNIIAEGEVLQLLNNRNADITEESYLQVIRFKTAKLFEAASRLGAIIAKASMEDEQAMANYGMHLGTAFQLIDDVLDYSGDKSTTGKNIGDDLAEGKPTLPLIYAIKKAPPNEGQIIRDAILKGGIAQLPSVIKTLAATSALSYVRDQAKREADTARRAIAHLKDNAYKESLLQLTEFAVTRTY